MALAARLHFEGRPGYSNRENLKTGPPECLRPAGRRPDFEGSQQDSGRNPARETDLRPGSIIAYPRRFQTPAEAVPLDAQKVAQTTYGQDPAGRTGTGKTVKVLKNAQK